MKVLMATVKKYILQRILTTGVYGQNYDFLVLTYNLTNTPKGGFVRCSAKRVSPIFFVAKYLSCYFYDHIAIYNGA